MNPTSRLLQLLGLPALLSLAIVVYPAVSQGVLLIDGLLMLMALADLLTLPSKQGLTIERQGSHLLSLGTSNRFQLVINNRTARPRYLTVNESFPRSMGLSGLPACGWVAPWSTLTLPYTVLPHRRGAYKIGQTYLRCNSRLALWQRRFKLTIAPDLKVFPNLKMLNTYALLAKRNRIDLLGFRKTRGRGSDVEFDRLRDYQPDDDYRRIDPFASARYQKPITREYEVSRNQNIFFMVDCSHAMASESKGLSNLDHALNAVLMLSSIALDFGDNVGLMAFDQSIRSLMPTARGLRSKASVLQAIYNLHEGVTEANYDTAFAILNQRVRQRSLVVLITNVMDTASYNLLLPHLRLAARKHLPLVLLLRDADLFKLADQPPATIQGFFEMGAAAELARWREKMALDLQKTGSLVLDLFPQQTTPELINVYLRIKADQLL